MRHHLMRVSLRGLFLMAIVLVAPLIQAQTLNIYVGQGQMPFADSGARGVGVFGELMHELCRRMQQQCVFRSLPWRRVLSAAAADPNGIVLNLGRISEREHSFVWLLQVLPTPYVLASRGRRFDSVSEALAAGPVAVMAGTPRAREVQAQRQGAQQVVEVMDPEQAARLLHSGRVVAWYEIDLRIHYLWKRLAYDSRELVYGNPVDAIQGYIASSRGLKDAQVLREDMARAFTAMRADGSWQRILSGYFDEARSTALVAAPLH